MMNAGVRSLRLEHDHMRRMMDCFDRELDVFEQAEQPDYEVISESLAYCKDYLDVWHHPREDRLLELLRQRRGDKAAPLSELNDQHRHLASTTTQVVRVFRDVAERGSVHLREDLVRTGRELSAAYSHHIEWEERHFFPVVDQVLDDSDWETVLGEFPGAPDSRDPGMIRRRYPALFSAIEAAA